MDFIINEIVALRRISTILVSFLFQLGANRRRTETADIIKFFTLRQDQQEPFADRDGFPAFRAEKRGSFQALEVRPGFFRHDGERGFRGSGSHQSGLVVKSKAVREWAGKV